MSSVIGTQTFAGGPLASTFNVAFNLAGTPLAGDFLEVWVACDGNETPLCPLLGSPVFPSPLAGNLVTGQMFIYQCNGTETGDFVIDISPSERLVNGYVRLIRGAGSYQSNDWIDADSNSGTPIDVNNIGFGPITPPANTDVLFSIAVAVDNGTKPDIVLTTPYDTNKVFLADGFGGGTSLVTSYRTFTSTGTPSAEQPPDAVVANDDGAVSATIMYLPAAAAIISDPTASEGDTNATLGCTTDSATGTLYAVIDSVANMSGITATQVLAGQNANDLAAVSANSASVSGLTPNVVLTGLTPETAYSYAIVQSNGLTSNLLSGTFTTTAAAITLDTFPATLVSGSTGNIITMSNDEVTEGSLVIDDGFRQVACTITSWIGDGSATFTVPDIYTSNLKPGTVSLVLTRTSDSSTASENVALTVQAGFSSVNITSQNTNADGYFKALDNLFAPTPIPSGAIVSYESLLRQGGSLTAFAFTGNADCTFSTPNTTPEDTYTVVYSIYDAVDNTWGNSGTYTLIIDSAPVLISSTILADGVTLRRIFSEAVTTGVDGLSGLSLIMSGGSVVETLQTGSGTTTLDFSLSRIIRPTENGIDSFLSPLDGLKSVADDDLVKSFSQAVVNDSEQALKVLPVITGPSLRTIDEGLTFTGDYLVENLGQGTLTLSGEDSALFTLTSLGNDTWRLLLSAKVFSNPLDANVDNTYTVVLNANDTVNGVVSKTVSVKVNKIQSQATVVEEVLNAGRRSTKYRIIKNGISTPRIISPATGTSVKSSDVVRIINSLANPANVSGDISTDIAAVLRSLLDALNAMGIIEDQSTD